MQYMKNLIPFALLLLAVSCSTKEVVTYGTIEQLDPALAEIISSDAKVELLGQGFDWSEGPLWIEDQHGNSKVCPDFRSHDCYA